MYALHASIELKRKYGRRQTEPCSSTIPASSSVHSCVTALATTTESSHTDSCTELPQSKTLHVLYKMLF